VLGSVPKTFLKTFFSVSCRRLLSSFSSNRKAKRKQPGCEGVSLTRRTKIILLPCGHGKLFFCIVFASFFQTHRSCFFSGTKTANPLCLILRRQRKTSNVELGAKQKKSRVIRSIEQKFPEEGLSLGSRETLFEVKHKSMRIKNVFWLCYLCL